MDEIEEMIMLFRSQAQLMRHAVEKSNQGTWQPSRTGHFYRARSATLRAAEEWDEAAERLEALRRQPKDYAEAV